MFKVLVGQAQRLFSSKSNGGKQVPKLTDKLHTHKQVLLALSIVLLLGYSQFRAHFQCQGIDKIDSATMTNFCLINGTTTVVNKNNYESDLEIPHAGHTFHTNDGDQRVINHNYMRSLWALLILLSLCSYFARRKWASIFENDVLQAILQLPGFEESRLVKAAESAKPYEMLAIGSNEKVDDRMRDPSVVAMPRSEQVVYKINFVDHKVNVYDQKLDYYPNQLIYLLLTKNTTAYRLSCLKLRKKLLFYSLYSTSLSLMQFILPLIFIGGEYSTYGWRFLISFLDYIWRLMTSNKPILDNSIDYELSSTIFPTSTQCEYKQYGIAGGTEKVIVQCTVAINEICGKLFVAIWWFVVVDLLVEVLSLLLFIICSFNFSTTRWSYGLRFWPHSRQDADLIASFRHRRAELLKRKHRFQVLNHSFDGVKVIRNKFENATGSRDYARPASDLHHGTLPAHEKKRLEAEGWREDQPNHATGDKRWYNCSLHDACSSLVCYICCCASKRRESLEREPERDINVYFLLYLIYLRLGKSKSRVEEVIRMTSGALGNYLDDLRNSDDSGKRTAGNDVQQVERNNSASISKTNNGDIEQTNALKEVQEC